MANTNGETLSELERQAESRRAELAQTVDELHNRVSPDAIKADVRNYARDKSQHMLQSMEARVRENPLQALALAVGIAYPLWRIIGRVPAPVLLIGAGLALSRRGGTSSYRAEDVYADELDDYPEPYARDREGGLGSVTSKLSSAASGIAEKASGIAEKASEAMDKVRGLATDKASAASSTLSDTYQSGREAASDAAEQLSETYSRTRDNVVDLLERYPLVAGGVAFAAGGIVASSLPVTRQENRLLGETSDEVKRRTQGLASEGLEHAKSAAQQVYEAASSEVSQEGFTPDAARNTVRAAAETAREAVEQTMDSAMGRQKARQPRTPRNS